MDPDREFRYLDNAATTRTSPAAGEVLARLSAEEYGNPSSLHPLGIRARRILEEAREFLRGACGASGLVFTGGGTEATNLALRGVLAERPGRILAGAADHPSVRRTAEDLARRGFGELVLYPVARSGQPDLEAFAESLNEDTTLVSILYGHNEVGTLPPLDEMVRLVRTRAPRAHLHVDAVQAFAKIPVDLERFGADSMTIAAHKIHGPKGIGALLLGPKRRPAPLITGGGQEGGLRSGTENPAGAAAFAQAAEEWISRQAEVTGRIEGLRDRLEAELKAALPELVVLGDPASRLPHILAVSLPGLRGEVLMHHLEADGICVSTGSACSQRRRAKEGAEERALAAMGLPRELIDGALRISFGRFNDEEDVAAVAAALPRAASELKRLGLR